MLSQSWHNFFISCIGSNTGNKDSSVYSSAWDQATANNAKLALLNNNTNTALFAMDGNNKIINVHSVKNLGGTILNPANCYGTLIGNGHVASAVIVKEASLLSHVNIAMPQNKNIIACLARQTSRQYPAPIREPPTIFAALHLFSLLHGYSKQSWRQMRMIQGSSSLPLPRQLQILTTNLRMIPSISQAQKSDSSHSRNGNGELLQAGSQD
jgi:hypothetical protein